eukprot:1880260-Alexandrium_andersonii.AAC.1
MEAAVHRAVPSCPLIQDRKPGIVLGSSRSQTATVSHSPPSPACAQGQSDTWQDCTRPSSGPT